MCSTQNTEVSYRGPKMVSIHQVWRIQECSGLIFEGKYQTQGRANVRQLRKCQQTIASVRPPAASPMNKKWGDPQRFSGPSEQVLATCGSEARTQGILLSWSVFLLEVVQNFSSKGQMKQQVSVHSGNGISSYLCVHSQVISLFLSL